MNAQQEATLSTLHDLIDICRDGEEGFRKASECIHKDSELKMLLMSFSLQRGKFARELEAEVVSLGGEVPKGGGSVTGNLHRWWMSLEAKSTHDNHFVLGECERGEDAAKEAYHKALLDSMSMPDSLRSLLLRQQQEVHKVHDVVKRRRDGTWSPTQAKAEEVRSQFEEKFAATTETLQAGAGQIASTASETWEDMQTPVGRRRTMRRITGFIRENPVPLLVGALGTGIALGLFFYARELRNERERIAMMRNPLNRLGQIGLGARAAMEELKLRAKDNFTALTDRMDALEAKGNRETLMGKLKKAFHSFAG